jgi:glycosyltransferase involved in cell wall biosynthesis
MKIEFTLHDEPSSDAGGMGVTSGLTGVYRELGHEVDLLCFADLPKPLPYAAKSVLFPALVATRMRGAAVDVIDAAIGDGWILGPTRGRGDGKRPLLVCRSHGLTYIADKMKREEARRGHIELSWKYPIYWGGLRIKQETAALRSADLCLLLNEQEREIVVERLGVAEEKAQVVDNGLPQALLGLPLPPLDPPPERLRIAHIGSYLPQKGVAYLVAALQAVLARHPDARATLLGTGGDAQTVLADFAPEQRSRVDVVPSYRRQDLPELLRGHALILSASLKEGFPLGTLEAMACGLAPVVSDIPGPTQYVRDDRNGLVVAAADSEALAAGVERLIGDPELFERLRAGAHATAQEYGWERVGRETLELYGEAIERLQPTLQSPRAAVTGDL